jgi:hypothetical protein
MGRTPDEIEPILQESSLIKDMVYLAVLEKYKYDMNVATLNATAIFGNGKK